MATFTGNDKAIGFLFDMAANIASDYSNASIYSVGNYAIYSGVLYKCTSAISIPEDFTPAHWQAVLIMDEITSGGGGGTTVIANPAGSATDTLNKLQVGATIYDVPSGGGGSGHTYSETEQIVGTWIDGKTVYEKTIDCGYLPNNSSKNVSHGITSLSKIISWGGGIITDSGAYTPIPYIHGYGLQYSVSVLATSTDITLSTKTNRTTWYAYITIRYTKTS